MLPVVIGQQGLGDCETVRARGRLSYSRSGVCVPFFPQMRACRALISVVHA